MVKIAGLQKTTLLDYPNKVSCIIFLEGCNFRCPFCHNASLVTNTVQEHLSEDELFHFLKKRQNLLDGVCITGGEPTLYGKKLIEFIQKIKNLNYSVKLDTNGSNPELLYQLIEQHLIDYVAMDIKNSKENYRNTIGIETINLNKIEDSIFYLKQSSIDYEFRTTVVYPFHKREDFVSIANWIGNCKNYYLQNFKDSGNLINFDESMKAYSIEELMEFQEELKKEMDNVNIRY